MPGPLFARRPLRPISWSLALVVAVAASRAIAQEAPPAPAPEPRTPDFGPPAPNPIPGQGTPERTVWRQSMWPSPTAEDWKKPCLLTWQRTWDDAVAVARETGKPILVCINMDGEIASEHYAGVRYRQPEIASLYEPYVTVIASVYRHTPRDHDDEGNRIPCPRFGGVTCGEHIAIEPVIYEKFCEGQRIAPRHIMVELDEAGTGAKETYDVFYRNDTASVFEDIRQGIAKRPVAPKPPIVRSDRPIVERVASREVSDRTAVERAYRDGDAATRRALLDAAVANADKAPLDLLRLAVFGLDVDASKVAREALTKVADPAATGLVADALRVPMDAAERDALIAALDRLGGSSALAKWLAVVHRGLARRSASVDPAAWTGGSTYQAPALAGGSLSSDVETRARATKSAPQDPQTRLALAEGYLALAMEPPPTWASGQHTARMFARHLVRDARRAAEEAEKLGATGWKLDAVLALTAYYDGDAEAGYARAANAVKALPAGDASWTSMAVLTVFAEGRWRSIKKAVKEKLDFPPEWLADVNAAYGVLLKHPLGTDGQVAWHADLLDWLGAYDQSMGILRAGLSRFPESETLHDLLRKRVLRDRGPRGLERAYDRLLAEKDAAARLAWFAGIASVVAAEQHRRSSDFAAAVESYGRAIAHFEKGLAAEPQHRDVADHAIALALAGRARVRFELSEDEGATEDVLAAFDRRASSGGSRDGMGISPVETAQAILARLQAQKKGDLATKVSTLLASLDPSLFPKEGE